MVKIPPPSGASRKHDNPSPFPSVDCDPIFQEADLLGVPNLLLDTVRSADDPVRDRRGNRHDEDGSNGEARLHHQSAAPCGLDHRLPPPLRTCRHEYTP